MKDKIYKSDSPHRRRRPRRDPQPGGLDFYQLESRNLLAAIANAIVENELDGAPTGSFWEIEAEPQIIPGGYAVEQLPVISFPPDAADGSDSSLLEWPESLGEIEFLWTSSDPDLLPTDNITLARDEFSINVSLRPTPGKFGDVQIGVSVLSNGQLLSTSQILVSVVDAVRQDGEVVTISGSQADDQISVSMDGEFRVDWNGYDFEVPIEQVAVVVILGKGGDDQILVSGLPAGIGLNVLGGPGNDLIRIDSDVISPAIVLGGSGTDTLIGLAGRDLIVADGADQLPRFELAHQRLPGETPGVEGLPFASASGLQWSLPRLTRQPLTNERSMNTTAPALAVKPGISTESLTKVTYQLGPGLGLSMNSAGLVGLEYASSQFPMPEFARVSRRESIFTRLENSNRLDVGSARIDEEKTRFHPDSSHDISAEQFLVLSLGCAEINKVFLVSRPANQTPRRQD